MTVPVEVSSSWSFDENAMNRCIKGTQEDIAFSVDDIVPESCVQFIPNDPETPCVLYLKATTPVRLSEIHILSECRRFELFSDMDGEYVNTYVGELIEDASDVDMSVFLTKIHLGKSSLQRCTLKCVGIQTSIWVLSFQVRWSSEDAVHLTQRFDMSKVDSLLAGAELTDKAKEFKKLFDTFQSTKPPSLEKPFSISQEQSSASSNALTFQPEHLLMFESRLRDVERRICDKIDAIEQRQNEKLEKIIKLLEER